MSEAEQYYIYGEIYLQQSAQCAEFYQIEGEYNVVEHFIDQIDYQWDLDHDYCLDA